MRSRCGRKPIKSAIARGGRAVGAIGGGRLTNEEAYLLQHVFRAIGVRTISIGAPARSVRRRPVRTADRSPRSKTRKRSSLPASSPEERAPVLWLRILKALRSRCEARSRPTPAEEARAFGRRRNAVALDLGRRRSCASAATYAKAFATSRGDRTSPSEQGNARGAEAMGMSPKSGPGYTSCDAGRDRSRCSKTRATESSKMLSIFGANPARIRPDGAAREALDGARRSWSSANCL